MITKKYEKTIPIKHVSYEKKTQEKGKTNEVDVTIIFQALNEKMFSQLFKYLLVELI